MHDLNLAEYNIPVTHTCVSELANWFYEEDNLGVVFSRSRLQSFSSKTLHKTWSLRTSHIKIRNLQIWLLIRWSLCFQPNRSSFESSYYQINIKTWIIMTNMGPNLNSCKHHFMAAISQTICLNVFSWMKIFELQIKFHWNMFFTV